MEEHLSLLIWCTALFLTGLAFYSLYGPCKKDSTDLWIAGIGIVGMLVLGGFWGTVFFDISEFPLIWQILLFIGDAFLFFWGLLAGMILIVIVWCLFVLIFMKKHAEKLFNYERQNKNK